MALKGDNEARLISRVIMEREIASVLARGVRDDWFGGSSNKIAWRSIVQHWEKYGEVPSSRIFKKNNPGFRLINVTDCLDVLIDQISASHRRSTIYTVMGNATDLLTSDDDFEGAAQVLSTGLAKLGEYGTSATSDLEIMESPMSRLAEYDAFQDNPEELVGIPTGFPTIDKATGGLQPGQLITIVALPKTGKSILAMQMGINAHEYGVGVLFQGFEMSNREQQYRHDAMRAHVSPKDLMRGNLSHESYVRYEAMLKRLAAAKDAPPFTLTDSVTGQTVAAVTAKAATLKPDFLIIDGVYLMVDDVTGESNTPQALTNITRGLKRAAQRLEIPILQTTQALSWKIKRSKEGVTPDSIGYSSSFFQDSDAIFGLDRVKMGDSEIEEARLLKLIASRNSGYAEVSLDWFWDRGLFEEPLTTQEAS